MSGIEPAGARVTITGAGSGIGAATAARFAAAGAEVIAVDVDASAAERTAQACSAQGGRSAHAHGCDVADFDAVSALAGTVERELGPVDVLVNNAGVGVAGPFLDSTIEDWRWLRSINIDGVAHGCYAFAPAMIERGRGQVVNVASGAAYMPQHFLAAYCASKAAVYSLSQCLRADWRGSGVGVSVVCPGVIDTPIAANSRYRGSAAAKRDRAQWLLSKGHSPDLVAKAIVRCVECDRAVVPVGFEARIAYALLRAAPRQLERLIARAPL